ncbi:hypothetical protein AMAG_03755 [Allomyces macrogynus ATCC 38327]|uniref:Uncharacterized protein n=1 Tax=Allomyces macrogynus (strain ATCC 38327) TaxID=578462 RepID=A0A0L0SAI7_ALLM3|nr:hypothetical protein AMAG_03755 [Allomyces macrogynus ATCC 38327]|eukprot:KNE59481.1 hypothetical protein AMAG_03755 [Allomyces macrogynus ATCC 38327]
MDPSQQQPPRGPRPGPTPTPAVVNAGDIDEPHDATHARAPRHASYGYTSHHHVPGAPEWRGSAETAPVANASWPPLPPPPMHPHSPFERALMPQQGAGTAAGAAPNPTAAAAIHAPADNSMPPWDNSNGNHARYARADRDRPSFAPSPAWPRATDAASLDAHNSTASRPGSLHAAAPAPTMGTDTTPAGSGGPSAGASRRGPPAAATTPRMTGPATARGHGDYAHAAAHQGPPPSAAHDLDDAYAAQPPGAIASRMPPGAGPGPAGGAALSEGEGRTRLLYGGGDLAPARRR